MRAAYDSPVTAERPDNASLADNGLRVSGPAGVWTLDGDALIASDADGPATVLVPGEAVRLIAVDLPLAGHAKRLAALPFAVEDRIAEPLESVHLALGAELGPRRYLVGVVRHDRMAEWIARLEDAGLAHAALVPDALALPRPGEGEWAVDLGERRAVVRSGDGTGFALPAAMLGAAWEAAGRPACVAHGAPLPGEMGGAREPLALDPLGQRLLAPALDLRQGAYARRRGHGGVGRRLALLAAIGVLAHAGIAAADAIALNRIAANREADTRALVAQMAPATTLPEGDIADAVTALLPEAGPAGGGNALLPAMTRVSAALAPLASDIAAQSVRLDGGVVTIDLAAGDPALPGRVRAALAEAGVAATVAGMPQGVRITTRAA